MNTKVKLLCTLGILLLLPFVYFEFMGLLYKNGGNLVTSLILSVLTLVIIGGCIILLPVSKSAHRITMGRVGEIVCIVLLAVTSLLAYIPVAQFFHVLSNESAIREKYSQTIQEARDIFPAYETYANNRIAHYRGTLQLAVMGKNSNSADYNEQVAIGDGTTDEDKVNNLVNNLKLHIVPANNDVEFNEQIDRIGSATIWSVNLTKNVASLDGIITKYIEDLIRISNHFNPGEEGVEKFSYPDYQNRAGELQQLYSEPQWFNIVALLLTLIFIGIWITPYLLAERSMKVAGNAISNHIFE